MDDQTNVLKTIAENTDPKKQKIPVPTSDQNKQTEGDAEAGGILGKLKGLMKGIGGTIAKLGAGGLGGIAAMGGAAALIGGLAYLGFRKDSQIAETKAEADVKKSELDERLQSSAATVEESAGSGLSKEDKIFTKDHKGLAQVQDEAEKMKNMSGEDKVYKQIKDYETNFNEGEKLTDKQLEQFMKTEEGKKAVAKYKGGSKVSAASPATPTPTDDFSGTNADTADLSSNQRNPDVYGKSAENFAGRGESFGGNDNSTTVVNAPVNNTTKQINTVPTPIRNQEASVNSYLRDRYT